MPKTAVETAVCDICGAEVRDGSLFCYNCGGSVSKTEQSDAIPTPIEPAAEPIESKPNGVATAVERPVRSPDRRQVRAANRQPTEIVWTERQGISPIFVVTSIVFVVFAIVIVILAFYHR